MTTFYIRRGTSPARHTQQSILGDIFTINNTPMECKRVKEAFLAGKHVACIEFESVRQGTFAFASHASSDESLPAWSEASSESLETDDWHPADPAAAIAFMYGK
jgi:hypothetical protein